MEVQQGASMNTRSEISAARVVLNEQDSPGRAFT